MLENQVTGHYRRDTWIALSLGIIGALLYGLTVFQADYFGLMKRGENGQLAIQMLDEMRRPIFELKRAELHLRQSVDKAAAISDINNTIEKGRHQLSKYLQFVKYNEVLHKRVARLEVTHEAWASLELELVRKMADKENWIEDGELYVLVNRNTSAFLEMLDVLGDGENPIHADIEAGTAAVRGLLASSIAFVVYLFGIAFWREWWRRREDRRHYENDLRLNRMAYTDSLTGLPNRIQLGDRFAMAIASARRYDHRLGILYLDLDGFKEVNDEMGHEAGDAILKEVAQRLQKCSRDNDTVARLGGDEFVLICTNMRDAADARLLAEKVEAVLGQPYELYGKPVALRGSIGIAVFPDDGEQPEQLLKYADVEMYKAKHKNKLNDAE